MISCFKQKQSDEGWKIMNIRKIAYVYSLIQTAKTLFHPNIVEKKKTTSTSFVDFSLFFKETSINNIVNLFKIVTKEKVYCTFCHFVKSVHSILRADFIFKLKSVKNRNQRGTTVASRLSSFFNYDSKYELRSTLLTFEVV